MHCGELDLETQLVERKHRNEPPTENTTWEEGCKDELLIILIYDFFSGPGYFFAKFTYDFLNKGYFDSFLLSNVHRPKRVSFVLFRLGEYKKNGNLK